MRNQIIILVCILAVSLVFWWRVDFWNDLFILGVGIFFYISIVAWCNIFRKAGYKGERGLMMLIPIWNIFIFLIFAFKKWPIEKRIEEQEQNLVQGIRKKF